MDSSIEQSAKKMKTDITFLVGKDEEKVPAFKQSLALVSPVFMKMLYGEFEAEDEIKIPQFEAEDFKQMLNYIYFLKIDFEKCNARNVFMIAHQYLIEPLLELCRPRCYPEISEENVSEAIKWNQIYQEKEIWERIKSFLIKNAFVGLKTIKGFKDLTKETVVKILKWNEMRCSVALLYDNLLEWTDQHLRNQNKDINNTNKKEVLTELSELIGLRVNDDLTYDIVYSFSPYNRTSLEIDEDCKMIVSTNEHFTLDFSMTSPKTYLGFKILLSNIASDSDCVSEEFLVMIKTRSERYKEDFKIPVRDSLIVKDVYFKQPVTVNPSHVGRNYDVSVILKYKGIRKRVFLYEENKKNITILKLITP